MADISDLSFLSSEERASIAKFLAADPDRKARFMAAIQQSSLGSSSQPTLPTLPPPRLLARQHISPELQSWDIVRSNVEALLETRQKALTSPPPIPLYTQNTAGVSRTSRAPRPRSDEAIRFRNRLVPRYLNRPSLLLYGLDSESIVHTSGSEKLETAVRNGHQIVFLLGTSGAGKTRSAFEFLTQRFGFYMSARVGPDGGPGAEDFHLMVDKLSTKGLSREDLDVNAEAVAHWVLAMLVARFEVLEAYLARAGSGATPYNFLMMQILPETLLPHDNDPINSHAGEDLFATLTEILRHAEAGALRNRIFECLRLFRRRFPDEKVPVVIDEVQILLAESTEFYAGTNNTEQSRPLYTPVVRTVLDVGGKSVLMPVVVSGTGLSVTNAEEKSGSMIAKGVSTTERVVCRSGQVFTAFEEYVDHFMDLGGDGAAGRWSRMWSLLRGRPRFAATFIETCLTTLNHMADSSGSLHEVLNEVTFQLLRHDNNKSLYAAVRRLHQSRKPELWNFAVNACASYIYTGSSIVFYREEHLELIEIGVGQLDRGRRAGSLEGRIDEPLVAMAMSRFCEDHDTPLSERVFQWMGVAKHNPSGNGFLWETVLPTELRRLFDGTRPMKDHPLFKTFSSLPTYFQYPATICPPVETTSLYGSQSLKAGDTYRLHHFLRKPLAPFLLPEFEAGPDIAFAVKFQSTPPITIACFLQAKLAVKVGNKRAAKSTTCPERFFSRKGRGGLVQKRQDVMATLREGYNREMGVIRITLAYPAKIGAAKVVSTSYPQRITRSRARGIATHPDVELLVDATNIQLFATEQHIKFLENLKGEDLEQRDVEEEVGSSDDDGVDTEEQYVSDAMDVDE